MCRPNVCKQMSPRKAGGASAPCPLRRQIASIGLARPRLGEGILDKFWRACGFFDMNGRSELDKGQMHPLIGRKVTKMNGLGNVIVILDLRGARLPGRRRRWCARSPATTGSASISSCCSKIRASAGTDAFIRIYNSDGSEAGACGNGTRCVAWYLMQGTPRETIAARNRRRPARNAGGAANGASPSIWGGRVSPGTRFPCAIAVPDTSAIPFELSPRCRASHWCRGQYGQSACGVFRRRSRCL